MDRSRQTLSALDELGQIQYEVRLSRSLSDLRRYFERVQKVRRSCLDDFDVQLLAAEVQDAVIERARGLREQSAAIYLEDDSEAGALPPIAPEMHAPPHEVAEIPPEVPRLDGKSWRRAIYLAFLFTVLICAAFFYLIQTARRINLPEATPVTVANPSGQGSKPAGQPAPAAVTPVSSKPTLRLYTDLVPGTVSVDDGAPQDLKDGELVLDNLQPGRHTVKVAGRNGNAGFSFDVADNTAPQIVGVPAAVNALAVLVSAQGGKGRLFTNAEHSALLVDGKPAGEVGPEGLALDDLGDTDHDLQVARDRDKQRFVLTYTSAPALTAYVKSDPNAGTAVVMAGRDGVNVFIDDKPYRRTTVQGQVRIPLKVGEYTIRVHKDGFVDPPPQTAEVKKAEETAVTFSMEPVPQFGTLQVRGAAPGTAIFVDKQLVATTGENGIANVGNIKIGEHTLELRHADAVPKRLLRIFTANSPVTLSGTDAQLEKTAVSNNAVTTPAPAPPPAPVAAPPASVQNDGEQVRKGGGFVHYSTPKVAGRYSFQMQGHLGGFLKHGKLQWYAGYYDTDNYVLFTLDGKHASVREVLGGKSTEVNRVPFDVNSDDWIQVDMSVKPNGVSARVRSPDGTWSDMGSVSSPGRDFTQDKVGFYIPGNDEVAISRFRFSGH